MIVDKPDWSAGSNWGVAECIELELVYRALSYAHCSLEAKCRAQSKMCVCVCVAFFFGLNFIFLICFAGEIHLDQRSLVRLQGL